MVMASKRSRKFRYPLEYLGLALAFLLVDWLSVRALTAMARGAGALAFHLMRRRRRIACENLLATGVAASPDEALRIARASFISFSLLAIESLKAETLITRENWETYLTIDDPHGIWPLLTGSNGGAILVSAHFGNWEVAAQVMSFSKTVVAIARKMNNPMTDKLINQRKQGHNFRFLPKTSKGAGKLIAALREGCLLAILADQHANRQGLLRPFLGRPASVHTSPARLHLITGVPICVGLCQRTAPFRFTLKLLTLIRHAPTDDRDKDVADILDQVYPPLEMGIRECPGQYLWAHRRWKNPIEPTADREPAGQPDGGPEL